jgi:hypothetical protein
MSLLWQRALVRELYKLTKLSRPRISGTEIVQVVKALTSLPVVEGKYLLPGPHQRLLAIDTRRSAQFRIDFTAARSYLEGVSPPEPGLDGITALNLLSKAAAIKDCFPFLECPVIAIFSLSTMGRV